MNCPKCGSPRNRVIDTRSTESSVLRKRACSNCGFKFFTKEELNYEARIELSNYYLNYKKEKCKSD